MSNANWKSESIQINSSVIVDVKANAKGVVLGQGNEVWFHDLHLTPEQAIKTSEALSEGASRCLQARGDA